MRCARQLTPDQSYSLWAYFLKSLKLEQVDQAFHLRFDFLENQTGGIWTGLNSPSSSSNSGALITASGSIKKDFWISWIGGKTNRILQLKGGIAASTNISRSRGDST